MPSGATPPGAARFACRPPRGRRGLARRPPREPSGRGRCRSPARLAPMRPGCPRAQTERSRREARRRCSSASSRFSGTVLPPRARARGTRGRSFFNSPETGYASDRSPMTSSNGNTPPTVRIAAAGDVHCRVSARAETVAAFAALEGRADLLLLAGDLTMHGESDEAEVLADACRDLSMPVFAVLGNHDLHLGRQESIAAVLADAGVRVLDRGWAICETAGIETGIVGAKGFVGGFPGSHLPDFGEPSLRRVYAEATAEVDAIRDGLAAVALCPVRVVLLHYAPTDTTLEGEPPGIWAFLGTDRLAAPIVEHGPDLVVHGHAHAGRFEGAIGEVPVFNVSVPVMEQDFWIFELSGVARSATSVH